MPVTDSICWPWHPERHHFCGDAILIEMAHELAFRQASTCGFHRSASYISIILGACSLKPLNIHVYFFDVSGAGRRRLPILACGAGRSQSDHSANDSFVAGCLFRAMVLSFTGEQVRRATSVQQSAWASTPGHGSQYRAMTFVAEGRRSISSAPHLHSRTQSIRLLSLDRQADS